MACRIDGAYSHYLNQCSNIVNWALGTTFSEILLEIQTLSFKKMHLNVSSAKWRPFCLGLNVLRRSDACVGKLTIIDSDNGLSAWTAPSHYLNQCWNIVNWPLGTNFSEILIGIHTFSFKKMYLKMSSAKRGPFCFGFNMLTMWLALYVEMAPHLISAARLLFRQPF